MFSFFVFLLSVFWFFRPKTINRTWR